MPKIQPIEVEGKLIGYHFECPPCKRIHVFYTGPNQWVFNGNFEKPSFTPSLRNFIPAHVDPDTGEKVPEKTTCHLHVTDGEIRYCGDCPHELAGKTIPMVERSQ